MKKYITVILAVAVLFCTIFVLGSCNKSIFDTTYKFNYAYVVWPDGTAEKLKVSSWKDYEGEQIQIKLENGHVYLFSSYNCVLACE